jgi:MFS family permease
VLCAALVLVMGSMTSLAVALPDIGRATGADQGQLTWMVDAYAVSFAGLLLPCGALGDRYGRRRMLIAGLVIFAAASFVAPIGDSPAVVIAARAVSGVAAALVMPATLSLITTTMWGAVQERAVGIWVATCTLGGALGLILAGLVLAVSDWHAILFATGVAAAVVALAGFLAGESSDPERPRFDLAGGFTSAAAIALVVFGINEGPSRGWASAVVWACLGAGLVFAVAFVVIELTRNQPLLDIRIFRSRPLATGSLTLVAVFAVLFAFFFLAMQFPATDGRAVAAASRPDHPADRDHPAAVLPGGPGAGDPPGPARSHGGGVADRGAGLRGHGVDRAGPLGGLRARAAAARCRLRAVHHSGDGGHPAQRPRRQAGRGQCGERRRP